MSNKSDGGRWVKRQSGNPGGRPQMPEGLKRAMQGLAEDAIKVCCAKHCHRMNERVRIIAAAMCSIVDTGSLHRRWT